LSDILGACRPHGGRVIQFSAFNLIAVKLHGSTATGLHPRLRHQSTIAAWGHSCHAADQLVTLQNSFRVICTVSWKWLFAILQEAETARAGLEFGNSREEQRFSVDGTSDYG
jgi:hypothetical protein